MRSRLSASCQPSVSSDADSTCRAALYSDGNPRQTRSA